MAGYIYTFKKFIRDWMLIIGMLVGAGAYLAYHATPALHGAGPLLEAVCTHLQPVLLFIMLGIIFFCDIYYDGRIVAASTREKNPIDPTGANSYINDARAMLAIHRILIAAGFGLTALLPVYSPLIKKINTSVEVAANENMGAIDISGEDA